MKKYLLIVLVICVCSVPCFGYFPVVDANHTWFVAADGNDDNTGHATAWPVQTASIAKLTITAAVTAASANDVIIIYPGVYDEEVDLSGTTDITLKGCGWGTIISKAAPTTGVLKMGTGSRLENLKVITSAVNKNAVYSSSVDRLTIDRCFLQSGEETVKIDTCESVLVKDSIIIGGEYGISFVTCTGVRILDCPLIKISNGPSACDAIAIRFATSNGIISGCAIDASRPIGADADNFVAGIAVGSAVAGSGLVSINNCQMRAYDAVDAFINGIRVTGNYPRVCVSSTVIEVDGTGTGDYSIYQANTSKIVLIGCYYDASKTYGTIDLWSGDEYYYDNAGPHRRMN